MVFTLHELIQSCEHKRLRGCFDPFQGVNDTDDLLGRIWKTFSENLFDTWHLGRGINVPHFAKFTWLNLKTKRKVPICIFAEPFLKQFDLSSSTPKKAPQQVPCSELNFTRIALKIDFNKDLVKAALREMVNRLGEVLAEREELVMIELGDLGTLIGEGGKVKFSFGNTSSRNAKKKSRSFKVTDGSATFVKHAPKDAFSLSLGGSSKSSSRRQSRGSTRPRVPNLPITQSVASGRPSTSGRSFGKESLSIGLRPGTSCSRCSSRSPTATWGGRISFSPPFATDVPEDEGSLPPQERRGKKLLRPLSNRGKKSGLPPFLIPEPHVDTHVLLGTNDTMKDAFHRFHSTLDGEEQLLDRIDADMMERRERSEILQRQRALEQRRKEEEVRDFVEGQVEIRKKLREEDRRRRKYEMYGEVFPAESRSKKYAPGQAQKLTGPELRKHQEDLRRALDAQVQAKKRAREEEREADKEYITTFLYDVQKQ